MCNRVGARPFATHYHQLVGLESEVDGLQTFTFKSHSDGTLRFLHTAADGPCDESYGVQVAALAGLPRNVVERATDLLAFLEQQAQGAKAGRDGHQARGTGSVIAPCYFAACNADE